MIWKTAISGAGSMPWRAPAADALKAASTRSLHTVSSLDSVWSTVWGSASPKQIPATYAAPLGKLGVDSRKLFSTDKAFEGEVVRLNADLASRSPTLGAPDLSARDRLTVAMAFVQAGTLLDVELQTPEVASLMFRLLSTVPLHPERRALLDRVGSACAQSVRSLPLLSAPPEQWWKAGTAAREAELRQAFDLLRGEMSKWVSASRPLASDTTLLFDQSTDPASGSFGLDPRRRDDRDAPAALLLPERLLGDKPKEFGDVAVALAPSIMAHELLHAAQHETLGRFQDKSIRHHPDEIEESVRNTLSLATQKSIEQLGLDNSLLFYLPHEREAWALQYLMMRSSESDPHTSTPSKEAMRTFMLDTFASRMALLVTDDAIAKPDPSTGLFWDSAKNSVATQPQFTPEVRADEVQKFLTAATAGAPVDPQALRG